MSSICILGRQPAIGLAELESLYGAGSLRPVGNEAALLSQLPEEVDFRRLGGTIKLCKVLTSLPTTSWPDIEKYLAKTIPEHLRYLPEGKLQLGFSAYGLNVTPRQLQASGLTLKKIIRAEGRSVRLIPNQKPALSSAQVLHNHLTGKLGWELVAIKDDGHTLLAQTIAVQDINAYAARDQARPKRDARVGMLPPKLAQIIINLASPIVKGRILDPFCGTGVVLQEGLLMGFSVVGTDLDPRMTEYTTENIQWIRQQYNIDGTSVIETGDATNFTWPVPVVTIAAETYLGRPFSALPNPAVLNEVMQDVDTIHKKFLQNVSRQTKVGFMMCLAVPAWKIPNGFKHLPILDHLKELGYTRLSFVNAGNESLIYHRPNQIVARELVVLQRN